MAVCTDPVLCELIIWALVLAVSMSFVYWKDACAKNFVAYVLCCVCVCVCVCARVFVYVRVHACVCACACEWTHDVVEPSQAV